VITEKCCVYFELFYIPRFATASKFYSDKQRGFALKKYEETHVVGL
jgi:hypothetical protein